MARVKIKEVLKGELIDQVINVKGWVRTFRNNSFIAINDGSSINNRSWTYTIGYNNKLGNVTVEKGSITINGTSLTVVDSKDDAFSVCIIPYTFENTVFKHLKVNDVVNLEFDIVGKYVARLMGK